MTYGNPYQSQHPYGQQQPYGQPMPQQQPAEAPSFSSLLRGGSGKAAFNKDSQPGTTVTGTVENVTTRQKKEFGTGALMYSQKGNPKYEALITIQTQLHETPDDDGRRTVYVNMWGVQQDAIRKACEEAHVEGPSVGDTFTATYVGLGQPQPGMSAPKLYEYHISKPALVNFTAQTGEQPAQSYAQPQQQSAAPVNVVPQGPDPMKVMQLKQAGKAPQEIAGLLGCTLEQVLAVTDGVNPAAHQGSEQEPAF